MVHVIAMSVNSYLPIYDSGWTFQVVFIYPSTCLLESLCEEEPEGFSRTAHLY